MMQYRQPGSGDPESAANIEYPPARTQLGNVTERAKL
jgi:hypothetical protein